MSEAAPVKQPCPLIMWSCKCCLSSLLAGLNLTVLLVQINSNSLWHAVSFQWNNNMDQVPPPPSSPFLPTPPRSFSHFKISPLTSPSNSFLLTSVSGCIVAWLMDSTQCSSPDTLQRDMCQTKGSALWQLRESRCWWRACAPGESSVYTRVQSSTFCSSRAAPTVCSRKQEKSPGNTSNQS